MVGAILSLIRSSLEFHFKSKLVRTFAISDISFFVFPLNKSWICSFGEHYYDTVFFKTTGSLRLAGGANFKHREMELPFPAEKILYVLEKGCCFKYMVYSKCDKELCNYICFCCLKISHYIRLITKLTQPFLLFVAHATLKQPFCHKQWQITCIRRSVMLLTSSKHMREIIN